MAVFINALVQQIGHDVQAYSRDVPFGVQLSFFIHFFARHIAKRDINNGIFKIEIFFGTL
jgi:hypothetical protein